MFDAMWNTINKLDLNVDEEKVVTVTKINYLFNFWSFDRIFIQMITWTQVLARFTRINRPKEDKLLLLWCNIISLDKFNTQITYSSCISATHQYTQAACTNAIVRKKVVLSFFQHLTYLAMIENRQFNLMIDSTILKFDV